MPTDTIYGIVGRALIPEVVGRIYALKNRARNKPFIILIPSIASLEQFQIKLSPAMCEVIDRLWPGPVSLALSAADSLYPFLQSETNHIAFRVPAQDDLHSCLEQTGPLIATSANPSGLPPAHSAHEAMNYFHGKIDTYVDQGVQQGEPSQLFRLDKNGELTLLRGENDILRQQQ